MAYWLLHSLLLRRLAAIFGALLLVLSTVSVAARNDGEKEYNDQLENEGLYADKKWQEYVQAIGDRLLAESGQADTKMYFYVVDQPSVNAYALGDGYIFVHRGLIAFMGSEEQLAGVIGHEIGHVTGHHSERTRRSANTGKVLGILGSIFTGTGAIADLANSATAQVVSGYGREHELEADEYGGEYLAKAGYNPMAMIEVIQILKDQDLFSRTVKKEPKNYHGLFATHPNNDKRLHDAIAKSGHLLPEELVEPVGDFWELMQDFTYGDEASNGIIKERTYYHSGARIVLTYPDNWTLANMPTEIVGHAPGGAVEASVTMQPANPPSEEQTPAEYVEKTLQRDDVVNGLEFEINGFPAFYGEIKIAGGDAQARAIGVIYKGNAVYLFKGEAGATGNPETFKADFQAIMRSFRAMTADDVQIANSQQIKVIVAKPGDTYKKLAQRTSIKRYAVETLRLLNGDHPYGEPRPGDFIKIVQ